MSSSSFSARHKYTASEPEIKVREGAPEALRVAIPAAATHAGMQASTLRHVVSQALAVGPNVRGNFGHFNILGEVEELLEDCQWFEVYDVIEAVADSLLRNPPPVIALRQPPLQTFTHDINRVLRKNGIGWQLVLTRVQMRGSETFESSVREGRDELDALGKHTSASELHEAMLDLSRRPKPELTGAIQHGVAALECLSKDLTGSKDTLGTLIKRNPSLFPSPLGDAIAKVYGFASNHGRHLSEGIAPSFEEAELVVGLAGVLCRYLSRRIPR